MLRPLRSVLGTAFLAVATLGAWALMPVTASADLITFTHTGASGSGSIGGNPFSDRSFIITSTGETSTRQSFSGGFFIDHLSSSISIDGVGAFTFVTATRTFINDNSDLVGFSRAGSSGLDLYNGPSHPGLNGWDMLSSIGPFSGSTNLLQWTSAPVITDGGQLIFDNGGTTGSFQAQVGASAVPEPTGLALCGVGALGLLGYGWRRRRPALPA